jgi:hypothetical protein
MEKAIKNQPELSQRGQTPKENDTGEVKCQGCGKIMENPRKNQKYCSNNRKCKNRARQLRTKKLAELGEKLLKITRES